PRPPSRPTSASPTPKTWPHSRSSSPPPPHDGSQDRRSASTEEFPQPENYPGGPTHPDASSHRGNSFTLEAEIASEQFISPIPLENMVRPTTSVHFRPRTGHPKARIRTWTSWSTHGQSFPRTATARTLCTRSDRTV